MGLMDYGKETVFFSAIHLKLEQLGDSFTQRVNSQIVGRLEGLRPFQSYKSR